MHLVDLVGIFGIDAVPPELRGFVHFQANLEDRTLEGGERVALLLVRNTESYIAVFMDSVKDIEEIESRLKRQECTLTEDARTSLIQAIRD